MGGATQGPAQVIDGFIVPRVIAYHGPEVGHFYFFLTTVLEEHGDDRIEVSYALSAKPRGPVPRPVLCEVVGEPIERLA